MDDNASLSKRLIAYIIKHSMDFIGKMKVFANSGKGNTLSIKTKKYTYDRQESADET